MSEKIQILELFGGIGSPRVALRNIGVPIKSIDDVEIDEKAVRSYDACLLYTSNMVKVSSGLHRKETRQSLTRLTVQ